MTIYVCETLHYAWLIGLVLQPTNFAYHSSITLDASSYVATYYAQNYAGICDWHKPIVYKYIAIIIMYVAINKL